MFSIFELVRQREAAPEDLRTDSKRTDRERRKGGRRVDRQRFTVVN